MNMNQPPINLNENLRQHIKKAVAALTSNPETQDPRILLILEYINKMNVYDRNLMLAYLFVCDYSTLKVSYLLGTSRQAIKAHITELNKEIQNYVNTHYKPYMHDADNILCD